MQNDFAKNYRPEEYENDLYQKWEKKGLFSPENSKGTATYANILPPPNANGELHLGHTSGYVLMDLIGRHQRMLGKKVLLLPGKDHAGIQSQTVYEKKLKKERNLTRHQLGREKFYQEMYDFCLDRASYMRAQEKKLGLSADWSREKFTLDPKIIKVVKETFVKMYNEVDENGNRMIYQGERVINWCPRCSTALADVEVEHQEKETTLHTFKYSQDFPFAISTTRPETKLGDTAVAIHPDDQRYKKYLGKTFAVDFLGQKLNLKIIADKEIEKDFGTGALGVTPAHSMIDWQMSKTHNLPMIKVVNEKGQVESGFGDFTGLTAEEARKKIIEKLKKAGLLEKSEPIKHSLAICERCKTPIEPLPSKQWFVNVDHANFSLKKEAYRAIKNDEIKIYPKRFKKIMLQWIENVHDWCISRQIWWGPRIPVWYKGNEIKCQLESPRKDWQQESDTFDTWFSSGQWAYTTLDFPDGKDYQQFYPSQNMIMGRDILPFWAFRMIILSLYRTRKIPFENLYFTGLIRDEKGQKMSKSKGNGIEPLAMIKKYGTDALRLSLLIGSAAGADMNLGEGKIKGYRNMTNKLWNVARFAQNFITENKDESLEYSANLEKEFTPADHWISQKMKTLIESVTTDLNNYQFSAAGEKLRDFTWNDLADWYLEVSKFEDNKQIKTLILEKILKDLLRLWHPFVPFITEAIWGKISKDQMLMEENWPKTESYPKANPEATSNFEIMQKVVIKIRNLRAEYKIEPAEKLPAILYAKEKLASLENQAILIKKLRTNLSSLKIKTSGEKLEQAAFASLDNIEIYLPLENSASLQKEIERANKELTDTEKYLKTLEQKLANEQFIANAPKAIVQQEKEKYVKTKNQQEKIKKYLQQINR